MSTGPARAQTTGDELIVSTGVVERRWIWNEHGLSTVSLKNLESGKEWIAAQAVTADWQVPDVKTDGARLISLTATESTDEGFTSLHLNVQAEIAYPKSGKRIRYRIWAYPGAPGLRTQVGVKGRKSSVAASQDPEGIVDGLPVKATGMALTAWGYADGTQYLNSPTMPILREETTHALPAKGEAGWASGIDLIDRDNHLMVVKESNKCFNTGAAANNGRFLWDANGVYNTGIGWLPQELAGDDYKDGWATWIVLGKGSDDDAQLALKRFDRLRYPVDPQRDIYIIANTWGSSAEKANSQLAAREANVLREISSAADLGIDIQQVDDGWEGYETEGANWRPVASLQAPEGARAIAEYGSRTIPIYPQGWGNIRQFARNKNVKLGLWVNGAAIPLEDLLWNQEQGGFVIFKYDFFSMQTMAEAQAHLNKVRQLILATKHKVRTGWDVTAYPRVGYYLARDQGAIYLENRKPELPLYKPYLVLRDAWEISKHVNLNKFEITIQNVDRVSRKPDPFGETSDAWKHPHDYAFAQTMMGTPVFFQETQLYTREARAQLKPLMAVYRRHRQALYAGFPFALGDKPDNKSWSGFQNYNPENKVSYFTLFRQIENTEPQKKVAVKFYSPGTRLQITNLLTDETVDMTVGNDHALKFVIPQAPGYLFLRVVTRL